MNAVALRMDDPGASSKYFEIYGKEYVNMAGRKIPFPSIITNFLFFKHFPLWRGWARYEELTAPQWEEIIELIYRRNVRLTVAVTACWVEADGTLVPYPEKFPEAAAVLKSAVNSGLVEVANHGLTHCVVGMHLPRKFSSNRRFHREFTDMLPKEIHYENIKRSQDILQTWLEEEVVTLVPPGNVFTVDTIYAAAECGIKYINCATTTRTEKGIIIVGNDNVIDFHDREIALNGSRWLDKAVGDLEGSQFLFVRELIEKYRTDQ